MCVSRLRSGKTGEREFTRQNMSILAQQHTHLWHTAPHAGLTLHLPACLQYKGVTPGRLAAPQLSSAGVHSVRAEGVELGDPVLPLLPRLPPMPAPSLAS